MRFAGKRIGFAMAASHCTVQRVFDPMRKLVEEGAEVFPILSESLQTVTTRFGGPDDWRLQAESVSGRKPWETFPEVEPIGPKKLLDALVVCPCTGNTMAKLANAISDSPVLLAIKAHLRNQRPVILSITTNDGLGLNAKNLGLLLNAANIYFVPFGQDAPFAKSNSLKSEAVSVETNDRLSSLADADPTVARKATCLPPGFRLSSDGEPMPWLKPADISVWLGFFRQWQCMQERFRPWRIQALRRRAAPTGEGPPCKVPSCQQVSGIPW